MKSSKLVVKYDLLTMLLVMYQWVNYWMGSPICCEMLFDFGNVIIKLV